MNDGAIIIGKRKILMCEASGIGLISYKTPGGGGTTDYAIDIYFEAKKKGKYSSFLAAETRLPMMYMPDAIRGTIEIMEAPAEK